jgi:hypothetical protein
VLDQPGLSACLAALGISEAEELEYCDANHVSSIAAFLLPIPQRIFRKQMQQLILSE